MRAVIVVNRRHWFLFDKSLSQSTNGISLQRSFTRKRKQWSTLFFFVYTVCRRRVLLTVAKPQPQTKPRQPQNLGNPDGGTNPVTFVYPLPSFVYFARSPRFPLSVCLSICLYVVSWEEGLENHGCCICLGVVIHSQNCKVRNMQASRDQNLGRITLGWV